MHRISLNDILFTAILIFPISTVIQGLPYFSAINQLLAGIIICLLLVALVLGKLFRKQLSLLIATSILFLIALIIDIRTEGGMGRALRANSFVYFPFWSIYFLYMQRNFDQFVKFLQAHTNLLHVVCLLWNLLVLVSFLDKRSFVRNWGDVYFVSFSNGEHRLASSCTYILALCLILTWQKRDKRCYLYTVIPVLSIFLCGARTYIAVAAFILGGVYYIRLKRKRTFWITILPLAALFAAAVMISPTGQKFLSTFSGEGYGGYWFVVTNGRNAIWDICFRAFNAEGIANKLVGNGASFVGRILYARTGKRLWAHNDFVQVLLCNGIVGLYVFFSTFFGFYRINIKKRRTNHKIQIVPVCCFFLVWLFNAMFNGVYVYTCAMLSLPFFFYLFVYGQELKDKEDAENEERRADAYERLHSKTTVKNTETLM